MVGDLEIVVVLGRRGRVRAARARGGSVAKADRVVAAIKTILQTAFLVVFSRCVQPQRGRAILVLRANKGVIGDFPQANVAQKFSPPRASPRTSNQDRRAR